MGTRLLGVLTAAVGAGQVLTGPGTTAGYVTDWTGRYRGRALAVVRPADTDPGLAPEEPGRPAPHPVLGAAAAIGSVFARKRKPHSGPASSSAAGKEPPT